MEDYSIQYILWGIDGEWMVRTTEIGEKFYPTDHCGYIQVLTDEINPKFLGKMIEKEGINLRFSRSNRASIERVSNIEVKLPDIEEQNKIIRKVNEIEIKIRELQEYSLGLITEKENIMKNILEIE